MTKMVYFAGIFLFLWKISQGYRSIPVFLTQTFLQNKYIKVYYGLTIRYLKSYNLVVMTTKLRDE